MDLLALGFEQGGSNRYDEKSVVKLMLVRGAFCDRLVPIGIYLHGAFRGGFGVAFRHLPGVFLSGSAS